MLNPNQNNRDQPKLTDRKPITIRISYIPDLAKKIPDAINFILMSMSFQLEEAIHFDKRRLRQRLYYKSVPFVIWSGFR